MIGPDYSDGDNADTNDGRVTSWGLADVAFELRTANLMSFLAMTPNTPEGRLIRDKLGNQIADRLGLLEKGWNES